LIGLARQGTDGRTLLAAIELARDMGPSGNSDQTGVWA